MAYFNERITSAKDLEITRGVDISTAGTLVDVVSEGTSFLRFTAATQLTSLASARSGKILVIGTAGSGVLLVKNLTGTAGNQINTGTGADIPLPAGACLALVYDDLAGEWKNQSYSPGLIQGGNAFGAEAVFGTNDAFDAVVRANGAEVFRARQSSGVNANARVSGTSGIEIPTGTTAQRPSTAVNGTLRYNSTTTAPEVFYNAAWNNFGRSPLRGLNTAAAIPAGFIGEVLIDDINPGTWGGGSGVAASAAQIDLTPGVWDLTYMVTINTSGIPFTGNNMGLVTGLTPTNVGLGDFFGPRRGFRQNIAGGTYLALTIGSVCPPCRVTYDGTTTTYADGTTGASARVYLKVQIYTYSSGTPGIYGFLRAIRIQ